MKALVLTVSARVSAGEATDTAGPAAVELLAGSGIDADLAVVADGVEPVAGALREAAAAGRPCCSVTSSPA